MEYKKTQLRLNGLEFLVLAATSASSYLSVVLRGTGMTGTTVGMILSINAMIGMIAPPVFGLISDKIGSPRKTLAIAMVATATLWLGVPATMRIYLSGFPVVVGFILVGSFFRTPVGSLLDSWLMQVQEADSRISYAHARKYGSLGFAVMSMISTSIVANFGVGAAFFSMPILLIPILLLIRQIGDPDTEVAEQAQPEAREKLQVSRVFKNYYLMTHFLCLMVVWMPFMLHSLLLPELIGDIGKDRSLLGSVVGLRALMEVPAFMLVPYMLRRFDSRVVIPIGFLWYVLEYALLYFTRGLVPLYLIMMMSGTVFAIIVGVNMSYVHGLAPRGLKATVVTMNGAAMSLSGILANALGGKLLDTVGVRNTFLIVAGMVLVAVCLMVLFQYIGKKRNIQVPE
ncbi:MFS transporter [Eubacteriales bacterium OttesenSCG-928-M02]|nr:MFS transporter [Eubacteriales bacterium OttesenSCG-928-M02]